MRVEETGIRLKRDLLYKQVWSTPMRTLAKQYGNGLFEKEGTIAGAGNLGRL